MFRTFNMGWGFAIIVDKKEQEKATNSLKKSGTEPVEIGKVTNSKKIEISYNNKKIILT